jgi:membrane protein/epoxyqueuosine reductase
VSRRPPRGVLARAWSAIGVVLSRDVVVVTNAIAFNFLLCLFPLLLVLVAAAQEIGDSRRVGPALLSLINELIPFEHQVLATSVRSLGRMAKTIEVFSLVVLVWGSSGIFMPVEMALNRVWGGQPRHFVFSRILAFVMTISGSALVFVSIALTSLARSYNRQWPTLATYGAKAIAFLLTCFVFFLIYRVIPDPPVGTGVAARAALWAGTGWEAAKYVFVINLTRANLPAVYGPLAFAVSLVLWAYVSSLVLVFGALMSPREEPSRR